MEEASGCNILVLDELGKMESFSQAFGKAFADWLKTENRAFLLATVPVSRGTPLRMVQEVEKVIESITVTLNKSDRNKQYLEVKDLLLKLLKK